MRDVGRGISWRIPVDGVFIELHAEANNEPRSIEDSHASVQLRVSGAKGYYGPTIGMRSEKHNPGGPVEYAKQPDGAPDHVTGHELSKAPPEDGDDRAYQKGACHKRSEAIYGPANVGWHRSHLLFAQHLNSIAPRQ
jgi:hypothetical protein